MSVNRVVIMGRIASDIELRYTPSNIPVCSFRVAVERKFTGQGGERETDFFDLVAWRNTAEFISKYFAKGRMIAVDGHLETRKWEDKHAQKRVSVEIIADDVSFCGEKAEQADVKSAAYPAKAAGGQRAQRSASEAAFEALRDDEPLPF